MRYHPFVQSHLLFMTALIMTTKDHNYLLKMVKNGLLVPAQPFSKNQRVKIFIRRKIPGHEY